MPVIKVIHNGPAQAPRAELLGLRGVAGEAGGEVLLCRYARSPLRSGWFEFEATFDNPRAAKVVWDELRQVCGSGGGGKGARRVS